MARANGVRQGWVAVLLGVGLLAGNEVPAADVYLSDGVTLEPQASMDTIRLRKLALPNQGFRAASFKWDPAKSAWVKDGSFVSDGFYEWLEIVKYEGGNGIGFDLAGIGTGIKSVSFKSPNGQVYSLSPEPAVQGIQVFRYRADNLPANQSSFPKGRYVLTYKLSNGTVNKRVCYQNAAYPGAVKIGYPAAGAADVPAAPTLAWSAVGAARYQLRILDGQTDAEVYQAFVDNAIETNQSYALPAGVLQAGHAYRMVVTATSPMVNCAQRGVQTSVPFSVAAQ